MVSYYRSVNSNLHGHTIIRCAIPNKRVARENSEYLVTLEGKMHVGIGVSQGQKSGPFLHFSELGTFVLRNF